MGIFKNRERQPMGDMTIIAETVHARTPQREILRGAHATIEQGEYVAIKGPSGSGKTLFANHLAGMDAPKGIDFSGSRVYYKANGDLLDPRVNVRQRYIGYVGQKATLDGQHTVADSIWLPTRLKGLRPDQSLMQEVTNRLGIADRMDEKVGRLSGGEQQRVAIARAFAFGPNVVILDEPTSALDQHLKHETNEMLGTLADLGKTIIAVTHEETTASRIINLVDGQVASDLHYPLAS